jgi:hypothetical protein
VAQVGIRGNYSITQISPHCTHSVDFDQVQIGGSIRNALAKTESQSCPNGAYIAVWWKFIFNQFSNRTHLSVHQRN